MNDLYKLMQLCKIILPPMPSGFVTVRTGLGVGPDREFMKICNSEDSQDFPPVDLAYLWPAICKINPFVLDIFSLSFSLGSSAL